jgi:hypothetical protein
MNVALPPAWTIERFLAWEERQQLRQEFDGVRPVAMAGGTAAHAAIQRNLLVALGVGLRGKACQPFGSVLKIRGWRRVDPVSGCVRGVRAGFAARHRGDGAGGDFRDRA